MTWEALWDAYRRHLDGTGLGRATRIAVAIWVPRFIALCERLCAKPSEAAPDHVRAYELELLWQPGPRGQLYAANTVDQALRMVRAFLRWAHGQGLLPRDPSEQLVLGRPVQPSQRILTPEELEHVLRQPDLTTALGLRDRCILELLAVSGMSSQELCRLDLADLSLPERLVLARQGGGEPGRAYGLTVRLQELMGLYCWRARPELAPKPAQMALFVNKRGARLCDHRVLAVTRACGHLAGLPGKLTVLCLRRAHKANLTSSLNRKPEPC